MERIGVVVLNYVNYKETISCVDSLLLEGGIDCNIIIVDNGSANDSVLMLNKKYCDNSKITIIASEENVGFAKGMNLGIKKLRKQGIAFIFIANSDLVFTDRFILRDMLEAYEKGVGVISPFIKNTDGSLATYVTFKKKYMYLRMIKTFIQGDIKKIQKIAMRNKCGKNKTRQALSDGRKTEILEDKFELTGCGYMYTPDFFMCYNKMYPETFLYNEEYATCIYLYKAGLKTAWANTGPVVHKHAASTPGNINNNKQFRKKIIKGGKRKILFLMLKSYDRIAYKYR